METPDNEQLNQPSFRFFCSWGGDRRTPARGGLLTMRHRLREPRPYQSDAASSSLPAAGEALRPDLWAAIQRLAGIRQRSPPETGNPAYPEAVSGAHWTWTQVPRQHRRRVRAPPLSRVPSKLTRPRRSTLDKFPPPISKATTGAQQIGRAADQPDAAVRVDTSFWTR